MAAAARLITHLGTFVCRYLPGRRTDAGIPAPAVAFELQQLVEPDADTDPSVQAIRVIRTRRAPIKPAAATSRVTCAPSGSVTSTSA